jgi:dihydroorotase
MSKILIKKATIINENEKFVADLLIENDIISKIESTIDNDCNAIEINAEGLYLVPGAIDDQVHFREPGLTHKGEIYTEAKAAVAGGITSYMEMPNTNPQAVTIEELNKKYERAAQCSLANYSFFMGTTNQNLEEIKKVDFKNVCGLKIFMGSSTGDMLVDNQKTLETIFGNVDALIATHCEFDPLVKKRQQEIIEQYGEEIDASFHPIIRNEEVCYQSSKLAVDLAKKYGTRLHILHISSAKELALFTNKIPLKEKKITAEACIHHLWFSDEDYKTKGNFIKWNPAVKTLYDRDTILQAVIDGRIDVIATDHAPHTIEEKSQSYLKAPSGGPLVQHAIQAMWDLHFQGKISAEMIVQKMSHNVADLFQIKNRGYIREGYFADLVLINPKNKYTVTKSNILYKCGWSPFENHTFPVTIEKTFVNGELMYDNGKFKSDKIGKRLIFER